MKESIQKMKLELKDLARRIKEDKSKRCRENGGYVYGLHEKRLEFRHKHVAYCLARGRTLEQVDSGKHLDMDKVNWILRSMSPESTEKLYVVVNEKLSTSQQAVQSAHAVAEFLKKNPHTQWSNGYLVLLRDKSGLQDNMECWAVISGGICNSHANFREPDLGNKITAYACFGPDISKAMKNKELL